MKKNTPLSLSTVFLTSLGCSKNLIDTEVIAAGLLQKQFALSPDLEDANIWLINTCGFIESARKEALETLEEAINWKKLSPRKFHIIVCGCLNKWDDKANLKKQFPQVDLWLKPNDTPNVADLIFQLIYSKTTTEFSNETPFLYDHTTPRLQLTPPHYAYIKIADGCDNHCSYCSIPKIRGPHRSRTIASVHQEVLNLLNNDVKEILLIGQDITRFGSDHPQSKESLIQLIQNLEKIPQDFWLRLLYLHPARFPDQLFDLLKDPQHLLPYIEMPIQHIAPSILDSMNRKVSAQRIREIFTKLRNINNDITLRTTFIVGYPGETEADFQLLLNFMKEIEFDRLGAFIFQPEPGTPAAQLPHQIPLAIAQERLDQIMQLQSEINMKHNEKLMGKTIQVMVDEKNRQKAFGRTYRDAPEIDNLVTLLKVNKNITPGQIVNATVTKTDSYDITAQII